MITWDEAKRQANITKHGIDFVDCEALFDAPLVTREDNREAYGEQRLQSYGLINNTVVFMVWTDREPGPHIISIRRAKRHEQQIYIAAIGH